MWQSTPAHRHGVICHAPGHDILHRVFFRARTVKWVSHLTFFHKWVFPTHVSQKNGNVLAKIQFYTRFLTFCRHFASRFRVLAPCAGHAMWSSYKGSVASGTQAHNLVGGTPSDTVCHSSGMRSMPVPFLFFSFFYIFLFIWKIRLKTQKRIFQIAALGGIFVLNLFTLPYLRYFFGHRLSSGWAIWHSSCK